MYAAKRELKKLQVERFNQRERDFEKALGGHRACYRKFLVNVAAFHAQARARKDEDKEEKGKKVTLDTLLDNAWEVTFIGDPLVVRELESYWTAEDRAKGQPPGAEPPKALVDAMLAHGSRSLDQQLELNKKVEQEAEKNADGENTIAPASS